MFRQIGLADHFVFYDDVQYDKHGWRNRNRVTEQGELRWVTLPVKASIRSRLLDVDIDWNGNWPLKLERRLAQLYKGKPGAELVSQLVGTYFELRPSRLVDLTVPLTVEIAGLLGLGGPEKFLRSSQLDIAGDRSERLLAITSHLGCKTYLSGPSAQSYLDLELFRHGGVEVVWEQYGFPSSPETLDPAASILDYLAHFGTDCRRFIL